VQRQPADAALLPRAGGVLAKATWDCKYVPTTVHLGTKTTGYWLWVCPTSPEKNEQWLALNCNLVGANGENINVRRSGHDYTRIVPPSPLPPAHGSGYWITCSIWYSSGPIGTDSDRLQFGPV